MKLRIVEDDKALAKGIELALSEKENEITVCYDLKTAEECGKVRMQTLSFLM